MDTIRWHFPKKLDEAERLLAADGAYAHAGGTGLLRRGTEGISSLVDLSNLGLDYFDCAGGNIEIGAMMSSEDAAAKLEKAYAGSILIDAFRSIPLPLRNRITVGGSVALFPPWSNIMGPLIAHDSHVVLVGKNRGVNALADFATNRSLREKSIIKGIRFKAEKWDGRYFRMARTHFDYSGFNISILVKMEKGGAVTDARAVVVGGKERFSRLVDLENAIKGKKAADIDIAAAAKNVRIEFPPKKHGSAEYLQHVAKVEIERALAGLLGKE